MPKYYLDIETTGLEPSTDKIVTIQYAEIDYITGEQKSELTILKEWETSEQDILEKFLEFMNNIKGFPVYMGFNLNFEAKFFLERGKLYHLYIDLFEYASVDLRVIAILNNKGKLKGSTLGSLVNKPSGKHTLEYYNAEEFDKILNYVNDESDRIIEFHRLLLKEIPTMYDNKIHDHFYP